MRAEGEIWKTHRRFALNVLKDLGFGRNILENGIQEEADYLIKNILEEISHGDLNSVQGIDPRHHLTRAVNNVISCLVFNFRCSEDEEFAENFQKIDLIIKSNPMIMNLFVQVFYRYHMLYQFF